MKFLNKLLKLEGSFIKNNQKNIIRIIGVLLLFSFSSLLFLSYENNSILKPTTASELAKTSVKVVRMNKKNGGSGTILQSSDEGSIILTNQHVCEVIKSGGYIITDSNEEFFIHSYKESQEHDLCLVKVLEDLKVNTKIADEAPIKYDRAFISGHPRLLPHVAGEARFSGDLVIELFVEKLCPKDLKGLEDLELVFCLSLKTIPLLESKNTTLITGLIMPGSSGSGVFNKYGELSAVVFAGEGRNLSYAFAVPYVNLKNFINNEIKALSWKRPNNFQLLPLELLLGLGKK